MTDERLAEIRARADAAMKGPWHWRKCYELIGRHWAICNAESDARSAVATLPFISVDDFTPKDKWLADPDTAFIAAARQDIPDLLDEVCELRDKIRADRITLERTTRLLNAAQDEIYLKSSGNPELVAEIKKFLNETNGGIR